MLGLVITSFGIQKVLKSIVGNRIKKGEIELGENSEWWISMKMVKELRNGNSWKALLERLREAHDHINKTKYYEQLSMIILAVKTMEEKDAANMCTILYSLELEIHRGKHEVHRCLKENLEAKLCNTLLDHVYPGLIGRITPEEIKKLMKNGIKRMTSSNLGRMLKICIIMLLFYTDIVKDFTVWYSLIGLVGLSTLFNPMFFYYFQIQVVWILGACLLCPLLISAVQIASKSPLAILGYRIEKEKEQIPKSWVVCIQVLTVVLFPLVPAMLVLSAQAEEEKLRVYVERLKNYVQQQDRTEQIAREIIEIRKFLKRTEGMLLTIKVAEVLENTSQIIIQTIMLALNQTTTSTTRGLEAVFKSEKSKSMSWIYDPKVFLILSIIWSFKTSVTTRMKAKKGTFGGFLPGLASALIGLRAFLVTVVKIACIVMFFAPYMGLFSIMQHWKSEQISMDKEQAEIVSKTYPELFRSDYTTNLPISPGVDYYVGSLQDGYLAFLGLVTFHIFIIFCLQHAMSDRFRKSPFWSKMQQAINILSLPDADFDWSKEPGDVSEHNARRKQYLLEVILVSALQWIINLTMLVPFWISGIY